MVHVSVMVPLYVGMVGVAGYSWENKEKGIDVFGQPSANGDLLYRVYILNKKRKFTPDALRPICEICI